MLAGPARQLITRRVFAQQAGQLGDVRFFDPGAGGARSPGHHAGVQPDAGHARQRLVRDPDAGQGAVPGRDARPGPALGSIPRRGDPARRPVPGPG